jgi:hypothetical protein
VDVTGEQSGEGFYIADGDAFNVGAPYNVTEIDIAIGNVDGTNKAEVALWTDSGGLPGTELGSWVVTDQPTAGSSSTVLATISNITGVHLVQGTYFITVSPGAADTHDRLNINLLNLEGLQVVNFGSGFTTANPNQPLFAFDVLGNVALGRTPAAPEPQTWVLLGLGLLALASLRGRRASHADARSSRTQVSTPVAIAPSRNSTGAGSATMWSSPSFSMKVLGRGVPTQLGIQAMSTSVMKRFGGSIR